MADLRNIDTYTVEEVNARLPLVRRISEDLGKAYRGREEIQEQLRFFRRESDGLCSTEVGETLRRLEEKERSFIAEIESLEDEITQLGGIVKDPDKGIVDFFSEREGHLICLSWMLGEEEVGFWHELDAGFAQRRPLPASSDLSYSSE